MADASELVIEITSDFVCPWCYIGEARLEKAIAQVAPDMKIKRVWRPYELNADMPLEGRDRKEYMTEKFGAGRLAEMQERMKGIASEEGLDFQQEKIKRSPNTRYAHRLTAWAEKQGKATELAMLIFKAYFTDGKDIGDVEVLATLAAEAGLDKAKAKTFLASNEGVTEVEALEAAGRKRGIQGVPFITIDAEEIHGAELVEDMAAALQRALEQRKAA